MIYIDGSTSLYRYVGYNHEIYIFGDMHIKFSTCDPKNSIHIIDFHLEEFFMTEEIDNVYENDSYLNQLRSYYKRCLMIDKIF